MIEKPGRSPAFCLVAGVSVIVLFSDFGVRGPYVGQIQAVLHERAPGVPVVELFSDAPAFNPRAAAYLLAAYAVAFPPHTIFLAVVDPGVGTTERKPIAVNVDGRWFVGPDNGLLSVVAARGSDRQFWEILWRPSDLSNSFHGRDLFAPVAAALTRGERWWGKPYSPARDWTSAEWPDELDEVIYVDDFGNAITGRRGSTADSHMRLTVGDRSLGFARTFATAPVGSPFWYINANGLVEIAVNRGSAALVLGIGVGTKFRLGAHSGVQ